MIDRQATLILIRLAQEDVKRNPALRLGQALFNRASDGNPAVLRLAGTNVDPFHDDAKVWVFLDELEKLK